MKLFYLILFVATIYSQTECDENRYLNEIFNVSLTSNVEYGENTNETIWGTPFTEVLSMNIYEPEGDTQEERPLVFFLHGGSFVGGSKTNSDIVELCERYAKRGYVSVSIDYRLTMSLIFQGTEENAYRAVMKAIHDLKAAIRYMNKDYQEDNLYRIDPERVYVGGISAGSIASVNAAYLNQDSEIPDFIYNEVMSIGGLEGESGSPGYASDIYGVINLCGAVGDYLWLEENDKPVVSMHGDADDTVPYDDQLITLFGLNIQVYGSYIIHNTMLDLGNYSDLYTYVGGGHCPFSNMDLVLDFTTDFMYDVVCQDDGLLGDVNGDGLLNILDIVFAINIILDIEEYDEYADLNDDGVVDILDIVLLVNLILNS